MSYKSFCGLLQDHDTGAWYYWCMGLLYLTLFAGIGIATFRQPDNLQGNVRFVICTLLMVGELAASIVNSWLIESMAQGRYLLPCILIAGYLASTVPELFQKKSTACCLVSPEFYPSATLDWSVSRCFSKLCRKLQHCHWRRNYDLTENHSCELYQKRSADRKLLRHAISAFQKEKMKRGTVWNVTIWPEPFCFVKTPAEQKTTKQFPLTQEAVWKLSRG